MGDDLLDPQAIDGIEIERRDAPDAEGAQPIEQAGRFIAREAAAGGDVGFGQRVAPRKRKRAANTAARSQ